MLLAHQGGWDEALVVLVPIGLFIALLTSANRRAKAMQQRREREVDTDSTDPT